MNEDDVRVVWSSPGTFLIRGSTIYPLFNSRKPGFIHLPLHFPYISSSTAPIHVKLGNQGKPLTRKIQQRRLRDPGTSFHRGRRRLPERHLRIKFKILLPSKLGPLSPGYFPSLDQRPPSILRRFGRFRICFWGRKVSFTSRISRV